VPGVRERARGGVGIIATVRLRLLILASLAAVAVMCVALVLVTRFAQPWLSFAALGSVGALVLARYGLIPPLLVRQQRQETGLCVACGYDLTGNVSGVCPECGMSLRANASARE
jgi:uncharacterized paraquat-inducible protein A